MYDAVMQNARQNRIFISAAAVADYRPKNSTAHKLKKHDAELTLELERTEDILAAVAASSPRPFVVGFAAETENLEANARTKLAAKSLDMIAANLVGKDGQAQDIGFNSEYNALHVIWTDGEQRLQRARKTTLARELVNLIALQYNSSNQHEKNTA
jgi:phosphopantothenoylcysteine decarboxylase/phosphopantothenate--cysteine ligase